MLTRASDSKTPYFEINVAAAVRRHLELWKTLQDYSAAFIVTLRD